MSSPVLCSIEDLDELYSLALKFSHKSPSLSSVIREKRFKEDLSSILSSTLGAAFKTKNGAIIFHLVRPFFSSSSWCEEIGLFASGGDGKLLIEAMEGWAASKEASHCVLKSVCDGRLPKVHSRLYGRFGYSILEASFCKEL